jgi:hypothetical protein
MPTACSKTKTYPDSNTIFAVFQMFQEFPILQPFYFSFESDFNGCKGVILAEKLFTAAICICALYSVRNPREWSSPSLAHFF